jgi:hypothetical protein
MLIKCTTCRKIEKYHTPCREKTICKSNIFNPIHCITLFRPFASPSLERYRQYNNKRKDAKMTNNDLQNTIQKTKYRATQTLLKTGTESRCSGRVNSSCSRLTFMICYIQNNNINMINMVHLIRYSYHHCNQGYSYTGMCCLQ